MVKLDANIAIIRCKGFGQVCRLQSVERSANRRLLWSSLFIVLRININLLASHKFIFQYVIGTNARVYEIIIIIILIWQQFETGTTHASSWHTGHREGTKITDHEGAEVKYSWRDLHIRNITITHLPVVLLSGGIIQVNRVTLCWWWW